MLVKARKFRELHAANGGEDIKPLEPIDRVPPHAAGARAHRRSAVSGCRGRRSRRTRLTRSACRAPKPARAGHHHVHVVFLRNPKGDGKAAYYVGMTGLSPAQRFQNHKNGRKAARIVKRCGERLVRASISISTRCLSREPRRWKCSSPTASASAASLSMAATDLVFTRHPRARRYILRVGPDGVVRVTRMPRWGSKRKPPRSRCVNARGSKSSCAGTKNAERTAQIPERTPKIPERMAKIPERCAKGALVAKRDLPPRVYELAARHGLTVARISIRNQRWRWGSCSRTGHICLNWRLVDMPEPIRDYVIIHELMHLKRMDHSPRFWKLVEKACPDYQTARRWLRHHAEAKQSTLPRSRRALYRRSRPAL